MRRQTQPGPILASATRGYGLIEFLHISTVRQHQHSRFICSPARRSDGDSIGESKRFCTRAPWKFPPARSSLAPNPSSRRDRQPDRNASGTAPGSAAGLRRLQTSSTSIRPFRRSAELRLIEVSESNPFLSSLVFGIGIRQNERNAGGA